MQYVPFGKTGMTISEIGLGAMQVNCHPGFKGAEEGDEPLAIRAVQTAVADCGVNFIDTARWYKRSQEIIGKALAELDGGSDVLIATKVSAETDPAKVIDQVEVCLRDLRRDHVDLMQIHSATDAAKRDATLPVLQRLRDQGKFRHIGVTMGYGPTVPEQAMLCIRSGDYDAIQLHVNALHPVFARTLLPAARAAGMGTLAMNPQAGGWLAKRCPDPARYDLSFLADLGVRNLHAAALKWCISLDCLDAPIPGSKRPEHIRANCAVSDGRYMTPEQMQRFEDMLADTIDTSEDWDWKPAV
ncbi:MAG: Aldo-keto reductase IolS [Phycisphaerae bacterium]|nr:Aldo-keto reductase IolS [Phycisphaerae bacterium]